MRVIPFLVAVSLAASAAAGEPPPVAVDTLVAEALEHNPEIVAASHGVTAARTRPVQERALPDPMVSVGWNSSGAPWPGAGLGTDPTANIGVMVSQDLPWRATRDLRGLVATREADAASASLEVLRRRVTADVKALYYRLAWAGAVTEALAHHRVLMETLVQVTESRYSVGAGQQPDVLKAQTDVTMMAIRLERMQQERAVAEARLTALLGRPAGTAIGEVAPLTLPDTAALDTLAAAIDRAPALDRDRSIVASADAALALARRDAKPALGVSAGYYNMGSMPDMYMFRLDVRVPLQRASRDAAVAERTSRLAEARAMTARTTRELAAEVDEDVQVARSAARLARLYHDTALPQARLALDSAMASYETGKIDFLSVTMSVTGVVEYEMSYYDELRNVHEALSRLEAVTGHVLAH